MDKKYGRLRRSLGRIRDFQLEANRLDAILFDGTQTIDQDRTYESVIVDNTDIEAIVKGKGATAQAQTTEDDDVMNGVPQTPQISRERTEAAIIKKPTKKLTKTSTKKEGTKKTTTVAQDKGKYQAEEDRALQKQERTAELIAAITDGKQITME